MESPAPCRLFICLRGSTRFLVAIVNLVDYELQKCHVIGLRGLQDISFREFEASHVAESSVTRED